MGLLHTRTLQTLLTTGDVSPAHSIVVYLAKVIRMYNKHNTMFMFIQDLWLIGNSYNKTLSTFEHSSYTE